MMRPDHLKELEAFAERGRGGADVISWLFVIFCVFTVAFIALTVRVTSRPTKAVNAAMGEN